MYNYDPKACMELEEDIHGKTCSTCKFHMITIKNGGTMKKWFCSQKPSKKSKTGYKATSESASACWLYEPIINIPKH